MKLLATIEQEFKAALVANRQEVFLRLLQAERDSLTFGELAEILRSPLAPDIRGLAVAALWPSAKPATPAVTRGAPRVEGASIKPPRPVVAAHASPQGPAREQVPLFADLASPAQGGTAIVQSAVARELARLAPAMERESAVVQAVRDAGDWVAARGLRPKVHVPPDVRGAILNRLVKAGVLERDGAGPATKYRLAT